jgi:2'-5' RNA ligase
VEPKNLHVTVWFIGEADEARAAVIQRTLEPRFATAAFDLHVRGFGAFPPHGPPRVLWLGIGRGADSAAQVYEEVRERLVRLGLEPERRLYSPHITVARVRGVRSRFSSTSKNRDLTPPAESPPAFPAGVRSRFSSSSKNRDLTPNDGGRGDGSVREVLKRVAGDCGVCRVAAVTLFRSRLSASGARYEPLLRIPLS